MTPACKGCGAEGVRVERRGGLHVWERPWCRDCWSKKIKATHWSNYRDHLGETFLDADGYRHVYTKDGILPEHRLVMAQMLGRELRKGESVHHKNGVRNDNRPPNLELWVGPIRYGRRAADLICPHCGVSYLAEIGAAG